MLSGEDFGYLKDEEQNRATIIAKRALLLGSVLFSISCFIYITVNAYYFAYHDKDSDIKVIKSPAEPIKIMEEGDKNVVTDIDKTIYENIDNAFVDRHLNKENFNKVRVIEQAVAPTAAIAPAIKKPNLAAENSANNRQIVANVTQPAPVKRSTSAIVVSSENNPAEKKTEINNSKVNDASLVAKNNPAKPAENKVDKLAKGLSRVQLAALTSKSAANDHWLRLNKNYPALFSNLSHFISEVNLGQKGTFYRLQVGNFRSQVDAEEFCRKFIFQAGKSKADCIIVE